MELDAKERITRLGMLRLSAKGWLFENEGSVRDALGSSRPLQLPYSIMDNRAPSPFTQPVDNIHKLPFNPSTTSPLKTRRRPPSLPPKLTYSPPSLPSLLSILLPHLVPLLFQKRPTKKTSTKQSQRPPLHTGPESNPLPPRYLHRAQVEVDAAYTRITPERSGLVEYKQYGV